uniref:Dihydroorotate dehydrogenase (quinone), mitochondrial n=1 Tax=Meloidogyne incognita TaxID=6306 RepID=A0A914MR72_MELIC
MATRLYPRLPPGYMTRSTLTVFAGSSCLFCAFELLNGNELFYKKWVMPFVHRFFEPESAHQLGVFLASYGTFLGSRESLKNYKELNCSLFGKELDSPIGLAAGFDKDGKAIEGLRKSGFSFIEIGSVTPLPQPGNPKKRIFRFSDEEAVINCYGFNSEGVGAVAARLKNAYNSQSPVALGINLGKNKETLEAIHDFEIGIHHVSQYCDYLVINISSPNTPGLRLYQAKNELIKLLSDIKVSLERATNNEKRIPKLFIKISPDLNDAEMKQISEVCLNPLYGVNGLIVTNTTITRPESLSGISAKDLPNGGLSGPPLRELSTKCVAKMYRLTDGKIPIIGCGGVSTGADAYEKIRAGASGVQIYTALVYQGFPVVGRVKRELAELLKKDGFKNVKEAVGIDKKIF